MSQRAILIQAPPYRIQRHAHNPNPIKIVEDTASILRRATTLKTLSLLVELASILNRLRALHPVIMLPIVPFGFLGPRVKKALMVMLKLAMNKRIPVRTLCTFMPIRLQEDHWM